MAPLTLLTKGHTLQGANRRAEYKMAKNALPRFGVPAPATGSPIPAEPEKHFGALAAAAEEPAAALEPAKIVMDEAKIEAPKTEMPMVTFTKPSAAETVKPTPAAKAAKRGIWRLLIERIAGPRRAFKSATVQPELGLALDRVTVKRNDLSDDDLVVKPRLEARKETNPFARAEKPGRTKKAEEERTPASVS